MLETRQGTLQRQEDAIEGVMLTRASPKSNHSNGASPGLGEEQKECHESLLDELPPLRSSWLATNVPGLHWTTRCTGWRMGVSVCTLFMAMALVINLTCTIWAVTTLPSAKDGRIVREGSCKSVRRLGIWIHLAINILSTIMLGASNYTMQCLASPTRCEIDKAHSKGRSLKIGILSVSNLPHISRRRVGLWLLLASSSIPLHLLFNSAVFEVSSTNDYSVAVVSEAFTQGAKFDERLRPLDFTATDNQKPSWVEATASTPTRWPFTTLQQRVAQLERLTTEECVDAYQNPIISDRRNLLAVASDTWLTNEGSLLDFTFSTIDGSWDTAGGSTAWICAYLPKYSNSISPPSCLASDVIANITAVQTPTKIPAWIIMGVPIQYCLSETVDDQHCQLQMSTLIMVVVLICNFVKTIVMTLSLQHMGEEMLVTVGDAAASFLKDEDVNTLSDRLVSKDYLPDPCWSGDILKVKTWRDDTKRWWQAPSLLLWCWCVLLWTGGLSITCALLPRALKQLTINGVPTNLRSLWNQGFGTVHNNNLVKLGKAQSYQNGVIGVVLLSNLPQILITGMYLSYNNIFTCMISNDEWVRFGSQRKPLRVSAPRGDQRSTYFLQLPYAFSIPLLCSSALLHWLVSQTVFLARIRIFDMFGQEKKDAKITTVGYSCIALILATTIGSGMIICCIALGFRHYPVGAPAISNSSRRISAACHPPKDELCIAYKAVQWGVITKNVLIRHCTLSTGTLQGGSYSRVYVLYSDLDASIADLEKAAGIGQDSAVPLSRPPDIPENPTLITRSNAFLIENYGSRDYRPRRYVPSQLSIRSEPSHEESSRLLPTESRIAWGGLESGKSEQEL